MRRHECTTSASSRTSVWLPFARDAPWRPCSTLPCVPAPAAADAGRAVDDEARRHAAHALVAYRPFIQPVVLEVGPALRRRDGPGRRRVDAAGRALYGLFGEAVRLRHAGILQHRGERVELVERLARLDPRSRVDGDEGRDPPRPVQRVKFEHEALRRRAQQLPELRGAPLSDGAPQCCVGQLRALVSQGFWRGRGLFVCVRLRRIWHGATARGRRRWWRWLDGRRRRGWWRAVGGGGDCGSSSGGGAERAALLALLPLAPRHLLPRAQAQGDVDDEAQLLAMGLVYASSDRLPRMRQRA